MTGKRSKHNIIVLFMIILGAVLILRLLMLTWAERSKWASYAEDMSTRVVYETGPRGDIVDRNGKVIAGSKAVYSIVVSRVDIDRDKALKSAIKALRMMEEKGEETIVTEEQVRESLDDSGYMSYMPIVLAEDVSAETVDAIQSIDYPGISVTVNHIREYPEGAVASHVIGYLGRISESEEKTYVEEKGYRADAMIGKSGIEKLCEDRLKGTDAVSRLQVDSLGNITKLIDKSDESKGETVRLTIDLDLQKATEEALQQAIEKTSAGGIFKSEYGDVQMIYADKAASGAAVAIDVDTGQVLAMASYPDFDPNDFAEGISTGKWMSLQQENPNDPLSPAPMYNIATMSAVQPGSTFKPVTALAALNCGLDETRKLYDEGYIALGGRTFGCYLWNDKKRAHGYLDLDGAMKVSCNYYFYDIATGMDLASGESLGYEEKMTTETIVNFAKKTGLGEKTGIEIEETSGILPSETLKTQASKAALKNHLMKNGETYFKKTAIKSEDALRKKVEKILNQIEKDLTLEEIIGKLKKDDDLKKDKIRQLADTIKYTYYDQMEWTMGDTFNISIGQGDNAYTPVQMANYMAVIGNEGIRNDVTLLYQESLPDGKDTGISQSDIKSVLRAMTTVTSEPGGSLYSIFKGFPYKVAAKTGTAQRAGKINVEEESEYLRRHLHLIAPDVSYSQVEKEAARLMKEYPVVYGDKAEALHKAVMNISDKDITASDINRYKESYDNFAWTVAAAPADDPQIAVAVMLVQGKTAYNAAPVAREIIGKYGEILRWEKSY